jgi:phage replication O-like protein O
MLPYPPDLKNGSFLQLEKSLNRAIMIYPFNLRQVKILSAIIDKTYGWGKLKDDISVSQLAEFTGIQENHCSSAIKSMVVLNVITKEKGKYAYKIGINKFFREWKGWDQSWEHWNKDGETNDTKPEKEPIKPKETPLTTEQISCWKWAKIQDYWQDKVSTRADFLKLYLRHNSGVKKQYEEFKSKSVQRIKTYGKKKPEDFELQDFGGLINIDDDSDFLEGDFKREL